MMKLYKYRPLSEFLFKELFYQEIYFASYLELNDPLDLTARIDFTPTEEKYVGHLVWFIISKTLKIHEGPYSDSERENNKQLLKFSHDEAATKRFTKELFDKLVEYKEHTSFISFEDVEEIFNDLSSSIDFKIDIDFIKSEIKRLTSKFLENSSVTCLSEEHNDFLMWSHYSSKHSGVCLEFSLENKYMFPYRMTLPRKPNNEEYIKRFSEWTVEEKIYWDQLHPVEYQSEQPYINFFEFFPIFHNEDDVDVMGLSKSWTHPFAAKIQSCFATKTLPWKYEKEWRAIHINFEPEEPEERIRHYPIECLSAIYFGMRTPEYAKKRIYKIFKTLKKDLKYFEGRPSQGRELSFTEWEYFED